MRTGGRSWLRPFLQPLWFREIAVLSLFINLLALAVTVFVMQVYDRVVFHAGLATLEGLVTHSKLLLPICRTIVQLERGRVLYCRPAEQVLPRLFGMGAGPPSAATPAIGGEPSRPASEAAA